MTSLTAVACVQVRIDNDNPNHTVLIIDSANRPGTLVEVSRSQHELLHCADPLQYAKSGTKWG